MSGPTDLDSLAEGGSNRLGNAFLIYDSCPETPSWFCDAGRKMSGPTDLDSLVEAGSNRLGNAFLIDDSRPETPSWFDRDRFEAGRDFFRQHALSITFGYLCALFVGFTVDELAKAVSFTGESNTADRSRRRYLNTMSHLYAWHTSDILTDKSSIGYRSIRYVRGWHDKVRTKMGSAEGARAAYISQYDTAVVQTGFVAPIILYPRQFGIRCEKEERGLSDYVYFWRVVGYVLGVEDSVNACGVDLRTTRRIASDIEQRIIVPGLLEPSDYFVRLSEALTDGMKLIFPWFSSGIIRGYVYPLLGLPIRPPLTWMQYFILKLLKLHFFVMYLVPWYNSYWNKGALKVLEKILPSVMT